uniref:General transcription factor IIH subunit 5 n=1 Tax=Timema tahoe TaxID=61484 RepID=A0A7R9ILR1_9NEOP|nr:unnamed protein product [Timema tahoe]
MSGGGSFDRRLETRRGAISRFVDFNENGAPSGEWFSVFTPSNGASGSMQNSAEFGATLLIYASEIFWSSHSARNRFRQPCSSQFLRYFVAVTELGTGLEKHCSSYIPEITNKKHLAQCDNVVVLKHFSVLHATEQLHAVNCSCKNHAFSFPFHPNSCMRQRSACESSDQAMKQFLLHLDETIALGRKFIIQDLDETHLFISADIVETLQARVDDLMDQISFPLSDKGL